MTYYFTRFILASRSVLLSLCILFEIAHSGAHNRIILPIHPLPFMRHYTLYTRRDTAAVCTGGCGSIPPMLQ
ncbi:hypothetical protein BDB00DRAFT_844814 [Zychaea mexicana]|uniref:uncharacterized protein n=1 Tax=Zychaea mexicana TaxID=64656 RepID=UPI0022FEA8B8|nr:uncharacterized protein BDB00DRAFT_848537 [Zychaea mexicana]XP_052975470.1 uncharacterized protein BDB00DRAFT_844814 [Zychaea mexicana]KAI9488349.1 hypothetical protein BDB00DRAFT_848537 [Zychaea mexicana]KAI9489205.1 hypothetical protein BDB00DRAFT_844814 [Zychaea mexicana]